MLDRSRVEFPRSGDQRRHKCGQGHGAVRFPRGGEGGDFGSAPPPPSGAPAGIYIITVTRASSNAANPAGLYISPTACGI